MLCNAINVYMQWEYCIWMLHDVVYIHDDTVYSLGFSDKHVL